MQSKQIRAVRDLPLPDSPIIPKISLLFNSKEISLTIKILLDEIFRFLISNNLLFFKIIVQSF